MIWLQRTYTAKILLNNHGVINGYEMIEMVDLHYYPYCFSKSNVNARSQSKLKKVKMNSLMT